MTICKECAICVCPIHGKREDLDRNIKKLEANLAAANEETKRPYCWCKCGALVVGTLDCAKCGGKAKLFSVQLELLTQRDRIAELESALEKHRWIPVGERLPEAITKQIHHSQDVLIVQDKWGVRRGYYQEKHQQWVTYGSYQNPQEYQNEITHWKPIILPEQAKKGKADGI